MHNFTLYTHTAHSVCQGITEIKILLPVLILNYIVTDFCHFKLYYANSCTLWQNNCHKDIPK